MEKIYPLDLQLDGKSITHEEYVTAVMAMQPAEANQVTMQLMQVSMQSMWCWKLLQCCKNVLGSCSPWSVTGGLVAACLWVCIQCTESMLLQHCQ